MEFSSLLIWLPIVLVTITVHEFSHGKVAELLGDPTPRYSGRLTLNPIAHIDPIGFLMLVVVHFGWAKPVPINPRNFNDPQKGAALVGLAGPFSNFVFAWFLAMIWRYGLPLLVGIPAVVYEVVEYTIWLNLALGVFNFIPIPPLDGSRILAGLVSHTTATRLAQLETYGFVFIILLIMVPGPSQLIFGTVDFLYHLLMAT